ncbi:hydrogenase assembly protein HypC [Actinoplanes sp. NBRC 14428]|uniref:Hydrogenase expression/formation protein HypC n=1 Tax=Pseudosporangium ferrugineum TaxID=439699 RepID=A0A2T0RKF7_9ACTN|nr:HypC/HybG/HupF family hydrogenase formation chaperone [Pseudosporangium ferrugineum]PRY21612.1 hydrogenase expression/formation protein HypC [Pseudosporangium ferrugineum]BCJ49312.1 hydrogenase assembly protein HypC [Actinoplanes sp. NBRC 14428]
MCLGIPGRVTTTDRDDGLLMGTVDFGGVRKRVCLEYLPDVRPGEYVIVHVGFAITMVDAAEAERTLRVLRAMGDAVAAELGERLP